MKSYLGWPLKLKDSQDEAHVTLKYLGDALVTLDELASRLKGKQTYLTLPRYWSGEVFAEMSYVMVFSDVDQHLFKTRAAVEDLREDAFPEWRPHVTFSKERWTDITQRNLRPYQVIESTGPLTLFVDKKPTHVFDWR